MLCACQAERPPTTGVPVPGAKAGSRQSNIESQVGGVISYHLEDALGNGHRAFLMNEVGIDNGVTKGFGVVCADADLGRVFGGNEALLERTIKHAAVVHS